MKRDVGITCRSLCRKYRYFSKAFGQESRLTENRASQDLFKEYFVYLNIFLFQKSWATVPMKNDLHFPNHWENRRE